MLFRPGNDKFHLLLPIENQTLWQILPGQIHTLMSWVGCHPWGRMGWNYPLLHSWGSRREVRRWRRCRIRLEDTEEETLVMEGILGWSTVSVQNTSESFRGLEWIHWKRVWLSDTRMPPTTALGILVFAISIIITIWNDTAPFLSIFLSWALPHLITDPDKWFPICPNI